MSSVVFGSNVIRFSTLCIFQHGDECARILKPLSTLDQARGSGTGFTEWCCPKWCSPRELLAAAEHICCRLSLAGAEVGSPEVVSPVAAEVSVPGHGKQPSTIHRLIYMALVQQRESPIQKLQDMMRTSALLVQATARQQGKFVWQLDCQKLQEPSAQCFWVCRVSQHCGCA
jgi:hypothetical protein